MVGFIKKLFGSSPDDKRREDGSEKKNHKNSSSETEPDLSSGRGPDQYSPGGEYFDLLHQQANAVKEKDYPAAARAAGDSLPLIRNWLTDRTFDGGLVTISIPALAQGGTMMALCGDDKGLSDISELISDFDALQAYREEAGQHISDRHLFDVIRGVVKKKPGVLQNKMKTETGHEDGRRLSLLINYLSKSGEIIRAKKGSTYSLYMADAALPKSASEAIYVEPKSPGSHRGKQRARRPKILDLSSVPIVKLPPSPNSWESPVILPVTKNAFDDPQGVWREIVVTAIPKDTRPDPAFRKHYTTQSGTLSFDDLAKSEISIGGPGAVMMSNSEGTELSKAPLHRDLYAIAVHPEGQGFAVRSKSNMLTIYDGQLRVDFETDLGIMPEVLANRQRMEMQTRDYHTEIRSIALTPNRDRYLVTHIDEAWCVNRDGDICWGLRMPETEPRQFQAASINFGTSSEIERSLEVLGLRMPVTPEEIRSSYRKLALQFHPDINPKGEEKMKELNLASERLTGLTSEELSGSENLQTVGESSVVLTITMSGHADWIYAAAFSGDGKTSLIGSYAGRVVRVDEKGTPLTVYDIASTPSRIVETESYLYVMSYTRLYVLSGSKLVALEDCPPKCDLLVTDGMVLLVEEKGVRVFSENGRKMGVALTKAPIRKVYVSEGDIVIETRTHRGRFKGLKPSIS